MAYWKKFRVKIDKKKLDCNQQGRIRVISCTNIISRNHEIELINSGIPASKIPELGHFTIEDVKEAKRLVGVKHKGLVFRYLDPLTGEPYKVNGKPYYRIKPSDWEETWKSKFDTPPKYLTRSGAGNKPYFSPLIKEFNVISKKTSIPVLITEGEKKADCLAAHGYFAIGLSGVYGWLDKTPRLEEITIPPLQTIEDDEEFDEFEKKLDESRILPELTKAVEWKYREVIICFDSDITQKPQVKQAATDLAKNLLNLGAKPKIIVLPTEIDGSKNGVDDFIVRHGKSSFDAILGLAKPALTARKKDKLNISNEPEPYEKLVTLWALLRHEWRYRPGMGWHKWTGMKWELKSDEEYEVDICWAIDAQGWRNINGLDPIIRQLRSRLLEPECKWDPPHLMIFRNGVLDIKKDAFIEGHQQQNLNTTILPYEYDPQAECPNWESFLRESLGGDRGAILLIQAFFKWVLKPKPKDRNHEIQKSLDLLGPKGTGKGTFLEVLSGLVGQDNCGALGSETFKSAKNLTQLLNKKVSIDPDACGFLSDYGLFNEVVSNEPIPLKFLYKDPVRMRLNTVIVRAYNRVIEVGDGAEGLDRRIIAIAFNNKPKSIDLNLSDRLLSELPGIFQWAWNCKEEEMRQRLIYAGACPAVIEASIARFEANNPEYCFLVDVFPNGATVRKPSDLYQSYVDWCKSEGISPKKNRKFSEAIQRLGAERLRKTDGYTPYRIPAMKDFDVMGHLGLNKSIAKKTFTPKSSLNLPIVLDSVVSAVPNKKSILPESSLNLPNPIYEEKLTQGVSGSIREEAREDSNPVPEPISDIQGVTQPQKSFLTQEVENNEHSPASLNWEECRGLSIQQPFATLIAQGRKRYETRGQKTNYRGPVLIHAPQKIDKHSFARIVREGDPALFPTKRVIAVADLTDCIFMDEPFINEQPDQELVHGLWKPGRWAWKLENIRPLRQTVMGTGALGLWKPDDLLMDRLRGTSLCDRVDTNNDPYEVVQGAVELIQNLLDIEGGRPWQTLRRIELSDRQQKEVLRRLDVTGRGYRIINDKNNPDWGVVDPALVERTELIDFRPFPNMSETVYAYCRNVNGLESYEDVFSPDFQQDDRREIPELPDRKEAEARQAAFEKVVESLSSEVK